MQETPMQPEVDTATAETGISEYLNAALMQTEFLRKILDGLQKNGNDLSLVAWREAFEAYHRTLEHLNKAMILAQEVFDGHVVLMSGSLSEDLICDEFQCLTWK
jgi:hypothetical protein